MFTYQSLSLPLSDHISSLIASIRPCTCPHSTHCLCLYQIMYIHITHCLPQTTCMATYCLCQALYMFTYHSLPLPLSHHVYHRISLIASVKPCTCPHITHCLCFYRTMYMLTCHLLPLPLSDPVHVHILFIASAYVRPCTGPHIIHCPCLYQALYIQITHFLFLYQIMYMPTNHLLPPPLSDHIHAHIVLIASVSTKPRTCSRITYCLFAYLPCRVTWGKTPVSFFSNMT